MIFRYWEIEILIFDKSYSSSLQCGGRPWREREFPRWWLVRESPVTLSQSVSWCWTVERLTSYLSPLSGSQARTAEIIAANYDDNWRLLTLRYNTVTQQTPPHHSHFLSRRTAGFVLLLDSALQWYLSEKPSMNLKFHTTHHHHQKLQSHPANCSAEKSLSNN